MIQLTGNWVNPRTGPAGFTTGQWYFVSVVANGTSVDIYINGAERAHQTGGASSATSGFGFDMGGQFDNFPSYFSGLIEDVAIFTRAFSAQEIAQLYDAALGAVAPFITVQPRSQTLYEGRTAHFTADSIGGTAPLTYRWQKDRVSLDDSGNISGATTASLTISNVATANVGNYRLIVSNSAGSVTSSVVALAVVQATGTPYESAAITLNPVAYWRLNETDDPLSGTVPAHDYMGGLAGIYGSAARNGFNGVSGPVPSGGFNMFEANNTALQSTANTEQSWVTVPAVNLNSDTVTFTMWIYPNGLQADYTGLLMTRSSRTQAGLGYGGAFTTNAGQLIYTWNDNDEATWGFQSGLVIPPDQWSFVAVVIEATKATLYLYNSTGQLSATNPIAHISEAWSGSGRIGGDPAFLDRTFNAVIDEVAVFNYALTPAQVLNLYRGGTPPPSVTITIERSGSDLILSWPQGTLLEAPTVTGPWTPVSGAAPPSHTLLMPTELHKFYQVQVSPQVDQGWRDGVVE